MLPASLVLLQCILTVVGARESGHFSAEEKGLVLAEHPATYIAPHAETTTHPFVLLPRAGYTVVNQNIDRCIAQ